MYRIKKKKCNRGIRLHGRCETPKACCASIPPPAYLDYYCTDKGTAPLIAPRTLALKRIASHSSQSPPTTPPPLPLVLPHQYAT